MTAVKHPVPDAQGSNLFQADTELQALLPIYLGAELSAHLQPPLDRLGALAGGLLQRLHH